MTSKPKKPRATLPSVIPRNDRQAQYLRQLQAETMIFGLGPAGTGKTFLAAAVAAHWLEESEDTRLVIIRPTITVENENLGALPGGITEKMDPYTRPVVDELINYAGMERVRNWTAKGRIEALPVAYIRGRSLVNSFIHVTESQNLTLRQMEAIVTRVGQGSVLVVEGDPAQTDLPKGGNCDKLLQIAVEAGIQHGLTRFSPSDVVRSELVRKWVEAFEKQKEPTR